MDSFPYLVARGICHYVDQHKNKRYGGGLCEGACLHSANVCCCRDTPSDSRAAKSLSTSKSQSEKRLQSMHQRCEFNCLYVTETDCMYVGRIEGKKS